VGHSWLTPTVESQPANGPIVYWTLSKKAFSCCVRSVVLAESDQRPNESSVAVLAGTAVAGNTSVPSGPTTVPEIDPEPSFRPEGTNVRLSVSEVASQVAGALSLVVCA